jgi:hypothetical protein
MRIHGIRRMDRVLFTACLTVALIGCGGGAANPTSQATPLASTGTPVGTPSVTPQGGTQDPGGEEGSARVVADGTESLLGVSECTIAAGTVIVIATASSASLSVVGTGGAASIEFKLDGDQWIAVGAPIAVDGSRVTFSGPALKTGATTPEAELSIDVTCD